MVSIDIGGITPETVRSIRTSDTPSDGTGEDLGKATIEMRDTATNRQIQPDDPVNIDWGPVVWEGYVSGETSSTGGILSVPALGEALPLKHEQAYRVFYETERSTAVEQLAAEETEQLPETIIHTGDDPENWDSVAPVAEPYAGNRAALYNFGTDMLFLGAREGQSAEIRTTYNAVPSAAIEDGFFELFTRLFITDLAGMFELVIELRTPGDGTAYRWTPDIRTGVHTYQLPAEEAEPKHSGIDPGQLRYRIIPSGILAEPFGMMIDHASTIPFRTQQRTEALNVSGVEPSDETITRRIDAPVGVAIGDLATEDDAAVFVDGELNYQPGGADPTTAPVSIERGVTPIRNVEAERDFEGIRNEVVVSGADDVEVIERDQASIEFYGRTRPGRVDDPSITSQSGAEDRARGYLKDNAWNDAELTYQIFDYDFAAVSAGEQIKVDDPQEGLDGRYQVREVVTKHTGVVNIKIAASTGKN